MSNYEQRLGSTHEWRKLRKRALRDLPLWCNGCGIQLDPNAPRCTPTAPELDHIVPAKSGGPDSIDNVQWMCSPCNRTKSDRSEPKQRAQFPSEPRSLRDLAGLVSLERGGRVPPGHPSQVLLRHRTSPSPTSPNKRP